MQQECNKLYRSGKATKPMPTGKSVCYIVSQMKKDKGTGVVAKG